MKAARIIALRKVEIIDLPQPQLGPKDVLVKVKLDPGVLITHRFTLSEIDKAFDLWDRHPEEVCKIVIDV